MAGVPRQTCSDGAKRQRRGRDVGQGGARADGRAAAQSGVEEPQVPPRRRQPWRPPPPQPLQPPRPPSPPPTSPSWPGRLRRCAAAKRGLQQSRPPQPAGPAVQATRPAKRPPRRTPMKTPTRPPLPPQRWTPRTPRTPRTPPMMRLTPAAHGPGPGRRRGRRRGRCRCRRCGHVRGRRRGRRRRRRHRRRQPPPPRSSQGLRMPQGRRRAVPWLPGPHWRSCARRRRATLPGRVPGRGGGGTARGRRRVWARCTRTGGDARRRWRPWDTPCTAGPRTGS